MLWIRVWHSWTQLKWFRNKLTLVTALKLSPVGRGYEVDRWPTTNIVLNVHTLFFLFFFFFFAYYVVLLLTVYWKADLALFRRPDLEKDKNKEQIWPGAVRLKIIILRAVIQSWNFADFDLYIGGETGKLRNLGFRQCKTIIIPLIPISCSSVSCCRRCLRCANRCSFCSAVSCWRLLLRCSSWIWSRRSRSRGVSVENLPGRGFGATCCACVWHNSANATRWQTQFARLLSQAHTLKINRDHRARLVSSNREHYDDTILLLYAGDIRVPPRVPASGPESCGGNNMHKVA